MVFSGGALAGKPDSGLRFANVKTKNQGSLVVQLNCKAL